MHRDVHGDIHGDVHVDAVELDPELVGAGGADADHDVAQYAQWLGDDALVLAQRLGAWISRAPELEEDIALGNIALDLVGQARSLLHHAGTADGRSEDDLAYFRDETEFRSSWLVEQPNGDFAATIARQLVASTYMHELYARLQHASEPTLAAIAAKAVLEVAYHRDHAVQWTLRLGDGTDESRRRMVAGLDAVWPYVDELFADTPLIDRLGDRAVRPSTLREPVLAALRDVLRQAGLAEPDLPPAPCGGRAGRHSEYLGYILAEMQVLARQHPGASW
ncbi:phenylacetate-CoA oxygenase subunit PaaI [Xylanimonas allomyrinae]|uniref:Phenylacetate-CoA oxygenase subunit PaaI n=1 Tax=Xylanimonas allomyrinae TaxID=2509459 RepID=A0A4P6ER14_9MICO|nr:phenylacetate-CoA oxygenase subunit PaaI [Xylanimonas allomyrinae]